ncbi:acylphosphatase [Desulfurivibrio sp. C05AmB]|jgi:acylphosphatase|uniref:acylphosphatase n=1 Tax=Desulfurivibrio sp. C05AmB TaxID=3374371 RepID=UPI00376F18D7
MAKARAQLLISGRVQGVFYRAFTAEKAAELGLQGWVRNTPAGEVEAVIEGERLDLERLLAYLRQGPPAAQVSGIAVQWLDYRGEFGDFAIRY